MKMTRCGSVALICLLALTGAATAQKQYPTIAAAVAGIGAPLEYLTAALAATGLLSLEEDAQTPITIFAPTDLALKAVAGTEFNLTLEETLESSALPLILEYQVIEGIYPAAKLSNGLVLKTLQGSTIKISITGSTVEVIGGASSAIVTYPNYAEVPNKLLIHVVDGVLIPKDITVAEIYTEVPVPAPLLDEALLLGAEATLAPVVAPATSSTRRLLHSA